jgi:hypothetical protein
LRGGHGDSVFVMAQRAVARAATSANSAAGMKPTTR